MGLNFFLDLELKYLSVYLYINNWHIIHVKKNKLIFEFEKLWESNVCAKSCKWLLKWCIYVDQVIDKSSNCFIVNCSELNPSNTGSDIHMDVDVCVHVCAKLYFQFLSTFLHFLAHMSSPPPPPHKKKSNNWKVNYNGKCESVHFSAVTCSS